MNLVCGLDENNRKDEMVGPGGMVSWVEIVLKFPISVFLISFPF